MHAVAVQAGLVAAASGQDIFTWPSPEDVPNGVPAVLHGHAGVVLALDSTVKVWNDQDGELKVAHHLGGPVTAISMGPTDMLAAAGQQAVVLDLATMQLKRTVSR